MRFVQTLETEIRVVRQGTREAASSRGRNLRGHA